MTPERRLLLALATLLATAAPWVSADTLTVEWDPVVHPDIAGYRVEVSDLQGVPVQQIDLPIDQTRLTVGSLGGACAVYCVQVRSIGLEDGLSAPSPQLCGRPDPELFDVADSPLGWRIRGDNFAEDGQVYLDGEQAPVPATWLACGELIIPAPPTQSVRVFNPDDGVTVHWVLPIEGYFDQHALSRTILIECRGSGGPTATVTAVSHTPGLDLAIEADEPGLGTDCAEALAQVLALPGLSPARLERLPLGADDRWLYLIRD